jgi:hypothetical protein
VSRHVDDLGRAYAGSQLHIQTYVNRRREELNRAVLDALLLSPLNARLCWVSPVESEKFIEYQDQGFLLALGLERLASRLEEFWPSSGPCWDALAIVQIGNDPARSGALLVEAKAHLKELRGDGCGAEEISRRTIDTALLKTRHWLGVSENADWTGKLYQYANRLAHLYFFLQAGIPAWLVNIYFLGDRHFPDDFFATREECQVAVAQVKADLGLTAAFIPHAVDVYLPARNRSELVGLLS